MGVLETLVKQVVKSGRDRGASIQGPQNDDFYALYPLLYTLLSEKKIGETVRELSKISIKLLPEGWTCTLTEPASGQVMFSVSDTLLHAFEVLEGRLGAEKCDWRPDKYAKRRVSKKQS